MGEQVNNDSEHQKYRDKLGDVRLHDIEQLIHLRHSEEDIKQEDASQQGTFTTQGRNVVENDVTRVGGTEEASSAEVDEFFQNELKYVSDHTLPGQRKECLTTGET